MINESLVDIPINNTHKLNSTQMTKSRLMLSMIAIAATAFVFSSCSDDDDKPAGSVTYKGEKINFKNATLIYSTEKLFNDQQVAYYEHELGLFGGSFKIDADGYASGKGDVFYVSILSSSTSLEAGTYDLDTETGPLSISSAQIWKGATATSLPEEMIYLDEAKIIVTKSGDKYTFEITGSSDGDAITGSFTGKLKTYEATEE